MSGLSYTVRIYLPITRDIQFPCYLLSIINVCKIAARITVFELHSCVIQLHNKLTKGAFKIAEQIFKMCTSSSKLFLFLSKAQYARASGERMLNGLSRSILICTSWAVKLGNTDAELLLHNYLHHGFPKGVVGVPSLEMFKTWLDEALSNLV